MFLEQELEDLSKLIKRDMELGLPPSVMEIDPPPIIEDPPPATNRPPPANCLARSWYRGPRPAPGKLYRPERGPSLSKKDTHYQALGRPTGRRIRHLGPD